MSLFYEQTDDNLHEVKVICSSNERHVYEKKSVFFVHSLFNGQHEWPLNTQIHCYYDGEPFNGIPIPLPLNYIHEKNRYSCYGIFCSASCVKAFMDTNPVYSNSLSMIWLKKIMCEVFNDYEDITAAPPKELLIKYGGELNIEQFRAFGRQQTNIHLHTLPFFTCALAFELVKEYGAKAHEKNIEKTLAQDGREIKKLKRNLVRKKIGDDLSMNLSTTGADTTVANEVSNINTSSEYDQGCVSPDPPPLTLTQPPGNIHPDNQPLECANADISLLPSSLTFVSADVGNRWGIRGLRKPDTPMELQLYPPQSGKSLFQDYNEKKIHYKNRPDLINPNSDPSSLSSSSSSTASMNTGSGSINKSSSSGHQYPPTNNLNNNNTNLEPRPVKRRGRPKVPKKTESPPLVARGTLSSFLKNSH